MATPEFNPNSFDAQIARVLAILEHQNQRFDEKCHEDREAYKAILAKQDLTNGRVNSLEARDADLKGRILGVSATVSVVGSILGWAAVHFFS